ncbi:DNA polymerase III sliding clamp (beta) subunit, PCNA homolog [Actinacidiphila yanglinensis]|uniref:DNA polymerase III sliding clamp (Beta) subunit, PCNA homolog n=1 Tax=Actinacidiphila yanglinensis TaxID=310779 RepID=A0A1H6AHE3_9ACTN|nr:MerR family transcriptional regulator [Actinacidiphila yanglinensis]SEG47670.1 DNA polymerase III sliding clamp (beta) subunit, PCNA homolog [Actinacidiphila yanglinensis]
MRSIGEMARDSGLGVSALRFYDGAGVLVPARVDPASGYRWYGPGQLAEARLLARLRRTGMPLADVRLVLAAWSGADTDLVRTLLDAHLRRLERGLSEARAALSTVRALLEHRENPMTSFRTPTVSLTVAADELAAALDAVRFAASTDPELPVLGGVLFDTEDDALRVVATDRYRMAVARAGASGHDGPRAQFVVPAPVADAMRALLTGSGGGDGGVRLSVADGRVVLEAGDRQAAGRCLDHDFPDYRRLAALPPGTRTLVDVAALRAAVRGGPVRAGDPGEEGGTARDLSLLEITADGTVAVVDEGDGAGRDRIAVDRDYLLDALDALAAGTRERLVVEFGAPTAPIAFRRVDEDGAEEGDAFSLLMPVRLED